MAKYSKYEKKSKRGQKDINPIWRGIGCILIIIVPAISYAVTVLVLPAIHATGILPRELFMRVRLPDWTYQAPVIGGIANFLSSIDNLGALLIFFVLILLVLSSLFSIIYAAIAQAIGPARYSDVDAEPTRHKGKSVSR